MLTWDEIPYLVVDLEMTGFGNTAGIVEVAAVLAERGEVLESFSTRVNPGMPIPEDASAVHGIYDSDVSDAPPWEAVRGPFLEFMSSSAPWVAHQAAFEARMLTNRSVTVPEIFCTLKYAQRVHPVLAQLKKGHRLEDLAHFFSVPFDPAQAHGALYDCKILAAVVPKLLAGVQVPRYVGF